MKIQLNSTERKDLKNIASEAIEKGAESCGVFGSSIKGTRKVGSDIDIFINDPNASYFGDVDFVEGNRSGSLFHVFHKRPGTRDGKSRFEEIQNTAEKEGKILFRKER